MRLLLPSIVALASFGAMSACATSSTLDEAGDAQAEGRELNVAPDTSSTEVGRVSDRGDAHDLLNDDIAEHDVESADAHEADTALYAGFGQAPLRFPIGTATVGYGPKQGPKTPYAESFPGTRAEHTALRAKALVLKRGPKTLALVRMDLIGVWQEMVRDAQTRLRELGHEDLADGLIVAATHTHRSGGRVFDHFIGEIAVGPFLEGFYPRVRDAIVDAAIEAKASLVPAQVGHATIEAPSLHSDRRCEHNEGRDDTLGLIRVEGLDGELLGAVINYAMHGTVLANDEFVLSTDAPGAVEDGVEAALGTPAQVLYLQSWAGDMAPEVPEAHFERAEADDLRESYADLRAIGAEAAKVIVPALADIGTSAEAEIDVVTVAVPLSGELINPEGDFDDYPFGGIYCMNSGKNCGPEATPYLPAELACVGIPEEYTVSWTLMSAARIGDLGLVTLPGEPVTSVGTELRQRALQASGLGEFFVVGYGQSYLSYLLHPEDYWMGGYEGASALMGPGFGRYLIESGVALSRRLLDPEAPLHSPAPTLDESSASLSYPPLEYEGAEGEVSVVEEPALVDGVWTFTWLGGDPAVDHPAVSVELGEGDSWAPARYLSGRQVDSKGPEVELALETQPSYGEAKSLEQRTFLWTARLPQSFRVPGPASLKGQLRFVVKGTRPEPYTLTSGAFQR